MFQILDTRENTHRCGLTGHEGYELGSSPHPGCRLANETLDIHQRQKLEDSQGENVLVEQNHETEMLLELDVQYTPEDK